MILQEILRWAEGLAAWQSDAIRRLFTKHTLAADDLEDLLALLKTEHGVRDPKGRLPKTLTPDQIPIPAETTRQIELRAIKHLRYVNAIADSATLPISPRGLTVIYGDNGSGKSGYSRVLKRACRARDRSESIHPNANCLIEDAGLPQADFEISVDGVEKQVRWTEGEAPPAELSCLAIFDSRCARAYLDEEDDFSYVPYGLDIFHGLAKACNQLKSMLEIERAQNSVDLTVFAPLNGDTAVGKLIASLSAKTTAKQIEDLARLTPEELAEHANISKNLKENNPRERSSQLRLCARRISAIVASAKNKSTKVNDSVVADLRKHADAFRAAQAAAELAARKFKEGEDLLPGTGGEAWRELFEAARRFALQSHPGQDFPNLGSEARCPLCQQSLGEGAARLQRFEDFIQQDAEKTAQHRRTELATKYKAFVAQSLTLNIDDVTYVELSGLDPQLALDVRTFEEDLIGRQDAIKAAITAHQWDRIPAQAVDPSPRLQALLDKLTADAETLEKASDEKARVMLVRQFNELDARVNLSRVKEAVLNALSRLQHQAKIARCLSAVKTNAISLKSSEVAEKVISKELADALNQEFKALGVGMLRVSLESRSDRGKALHKLKLALPQRRNPIEILSEGEQRAVAIASFLAEINLLAGKNGIVLDDPVSSLDHRRRERVARRLALEATERQVIVLTHDIYFLCVLAEEAKAAGADIFTQSLVRQPEGFGVPIGDLPFEGKSAAKRIGVLKEQQQRIAKLYKNGDEQEYRRQTENAYFRLRLTWERAVEEVLLRQVVLRFRKGIETQRLAEVVVEDTDYSQVYDGMSKCSNYAHDKAPEAGVAVPQPDELWDDIVGLEAWLDRTERRSKETSKRRKARSPAALPK